MEETTSDNLIEITASACNYPLLIKNLLHAPLARSPDQVIVYREHRHTYPQFRHRLGSLASALTDLGVKAGDVVAVLEWDLKYPLIFTLYRTPRRRCDFGVGVLDIVG